MVAQHSYCPVNVDTDLALVKGEEYEVLDSNGVWWMARSRHGQIGLIPFNYVQVISQPLSLVPNGTLHGSTTTTMTWYFPNVDRETAEIILRNSNRDGTFLIRPSTTEDKCFTLSLLSKKYV